MLKLAAIVCILLPLLSAHCFAQTRTAFGTYGLYPQGSTRVLAMGGAFAASSDDASGIFINPAGSAFSKDQFDIANGENRVINKEEDWDGDSRPDGLPYFTRYTSGFIRIGSLAIGGGISSPYELDYDNGGLASQSFHINLTNSFATVAWRIFKSLSIGVILFDEKVEYKIVDKTTDSKTTSEDMLKYYGYGLVFQPSPRVSIGLSHIPRRRYTIDESLNSTTFTQWFYDALIPSKTTFGISFLVNTKLKWSIDADIFGKPDDEVRIPGSFLLGDTFKKKSFMVPHGGFEYFVVRHKHMEFVWRGGGYNEPARIENLNSRWHFTMGVEYRMSAFSFSAAYDQAADFSSTARSISLKYQFL